MQKPRRSKKTAILPLSQQHVGEQEQVSTGNATSGVVLRSFFVLDARGYFVCWNDSFQQKEAVKPVRRKESINVIDKLIYHADQPLIKEKLLSVLTKGSEETAEARVHFQGEQEIRWFMMTGRKIMIKGKPFVICMILDITARKQQEDSLVQTADRFRFITEHLDGVVFIAGTNAILSYVSPSAENVFGYMPNEMTGKSFTGFLEEEKEIPGALAVIDQTCLNHPPARILELHFRRKNGSLFWGEVHWQYSAENGNPAIVGLLHDITLRKSRESDALFRTQLFEKADTCPIEELLHAALEELKRLTESTIGFCYFMRNDMRDTDLQVLSANADNFCSLNPATLFVEALRAQKTVIHNECNTAGSDNERPDNLSESMRTLVVPIMNGEKVTAIIGVGGKSSFYDGDDERVVNGFADLAGDLVIRKRAERSERNDQLSLIQAQKMAFAGSVIHKIAAGYSHMLTTLCDLLNLTLEQGRIDKSLGKNLKDVMASAGSSKDMMSQLIAFARSSSVMPIVFELNMIVEERLGVLRELTGENISIDWIPDRQSTLVKVDPSQIDQLLDTLCLNARNAIYGKGRITIESSRLFVDQDDCDAGHPCKVPGLYAVLSVTDNGTGIDAKDLPFIFEPFFSTREPGKAKGLGLSIAYGISKQNHGSIDCRTESGKGSTFTVFLPRYKGNHYFSQNDEPYESEDLKRTILLVEDEPDILNAYKCMLEKTGYTVYAVDTLDKAISVATEHHTALDLLLTNVVLREVNGCDLSQKLQTICPELKTLYISDDHYNMTARYGVLDDGVGFIRKPFVMNELTMKISELLNLVPVLP